MLWSEIYDLLGNLELSVGEGVKVRVERVDPNVGLKFTFVWLRPEPMGMTYILERQQMEAIVDDELLYQRLVAVAKTERERHRW